MFGAFQYTPANAQVNAQDYGYSRFRCAGLLNVYENVMYYEDSDRFITLCYPGFLIKQDIPDGVGLVPVSEQNIQDKSLAIFVKKLSDSKILQSDPHDIIQQLYGQAQLEVRAGVLNGINWIQFKLTDGSEGRVWIGKYQNEWYMFGWGINPKTYHYGKTMPVNIINSMGLGSLSPSTEAKLKQMPEQIDRQRMNTLNAPIQNIR
jgi:hypothetical protein